MRKIISSTYISLDGVIENPQNWTMDHAGEESGTYEHELLFSCDAVLAGRETYLGFGEAWPAMEAETGDYGVRINKMDHYVVSDSLEKGDWGNTTVIKRDDAVAEIRRLKEQDGQDIVQFGFGDVTRTLVENGLLDELRLWIYPVLVGSGEPADLLTKAGFSATFETAGTKVLDTGVILATFVPKKG
ncbi:dihydrofolate reductase family protein [Actinomadura xylanilytica]|uniref:dihydrofolate reductase family protein n=1 Tax=Actinomadura xylanilytica TaxID=887459 RepID=UPI00255A9031|nr:dihydrofolate reductase family protein [Actinomadura xylanilytica]MDL4772568.1 dihydrofolate reductase family protein [Actinomadura xylanilytica]